MVWVCEKNVKQQDCTEAKYRGRPRKPWMDNVKEAVEVRGALLVLGRSNNQHCSWTKVNGKLLLTGHRPTSTAVQLQVFQ